MTRRICVVLDVAYGIWGFEIDNDTTEERCREMKDNFYISTGSPDYASEVKIEIMEISHIDD